MSYFQRAVSWKAFCTEGYAAAGYSLAIYFARKRFSE